MSIIRSNFTLIIASFMEDFVHLHVHTHYSILDGQSKVSHLVDKAINNGMKGMAITDHGVMYGIKEFSDYCASVNKKRKKDGLEPFKPILGCEMYVAHHHKEDKDKSAGDSSGYHLIVLAKNYHVTRTLSSWSVGRGSTVIITSPGPTAMTLRNTMKTSSSVQRALEARYRRKYSRAT